MREKEKKMDGLTSVVEPTKDSVDAGEMASRVPEELATRAVSPQASGGRAAQVASQQEGFTRYASLSEWAGRVGLREVFESYGMWVHRSLTEEQLDTLEYLYSPALMTDDPSKDEADGTQILTDPIRMAREFYEGGAPVTASDDQDDREAGYSETSWDDLDGVAQMRIMAAIGFGCIVERGPFPLEDIEAMTIHPTASLTVILPSTEATSSQEADTASLTLRGIGPASKYFSAEGFFVPPLLGEDIWKALRLTRGPGGGLWCDAGGVYRSGAESLVADIVRRVLGTAFRANRLSEVMAWCKTLPVEISTSPPPENLLNVANGVLELDTLTLRPVRDEERFTYQIPVPWNPDARCPQVEAFVREVVPGDAVGLVAEIIGMCLLPTGRYRRSVMFLGPGSNGKSVLLRIIKALLGGDNISSVTLQALSEDRFAKAQLFGKLANVAGDLDSKPVERSGSFKMLTGEDTVTADHKFGQPFQFVNYATLVFSANEWPVSHDQTDAYFTRWVAIPFNQRYREDVGELRPGERRADPKLGERLTTPEELQGLLVRAVHGAKRLQDRGGFAIPQSVRDAIAEYRQWADTVMAWVDEAVTVSPEAQVARRDIYRAYQTWCKDNGRSAVSSKKFWPRFREVLADRGTEYEEPKVVGERMVRGLWFAL
jgi:P4 family phage/plasmid primase-like protien